MMHGGKSLAGVASPLLTTGRYSKYLPQRMLESFHAAQSDSELLALREDMSLIDARLVDMLQRVDTGESGETWRALQQAVHEFNKAERAMEAAGHDATIAKKKIDREEAMHCIISLVQEGMADYAAWREVKDLVEQRRKLIETEQKRLVAMQQMITQEQAHVLKLRILDIIKRNVTDRTALAAISREFIELDTQGASAAA